MDLKEQLETHPNDWVDSLTVEGILELKWITLDELNQISGVQSEFTVKGLIKKLALSLLHY